METTVIGKRKESVKMKELSGGDPWAEAPFYGFGEGNEHINGLEAGTVICATFNGLRVSNKKGPALKQRKYAVLTLENGDKIRLFTPGQLHYYLDQIAPNSYVEITYKGMEYVEDLGRETHQFHVKAEEPEQH